MKFLRKWAKPIGTWTMAAGVAVSVYALVATWLTSRNLPEGVCPLTTQRTWMYVAISLLAISLVVSFFEPKKTT